jgi:hypothetical protein
MKTPILGFFEPFLDPVPTFLSMVSMTVSTSAARGAATYPKKAIADKLAASRIGESGIQAFRGGALTFIPTLNPAFAR